MHTLDHSILQTIAFFDTQQIPLRGREVWLYLWRMKTSEQQVYDMLEQMVRDARLEKSDEFYILPGRGHDLVLAHVAAKLYQEKLWRRVQRAKRWLQWLPFIRSVIVCNSLAFGNVKPTSDIDLLIIVKPGHIWHARFLATVSMHYKRLRRHGKNVAGRMCLSFFVTTDALAFESMKIADDDVYLSYWIRTLKPVFGIETYRQLMAANKWIEHDIPNYTHERIHALMPRSILASWYQRIDEKFLLKTGLARLCERWLKAWMERRTRAHAATLGPESGIVISDQMQKFHDTDRRSEIREKWKNMSH